VATNLIVISLSVIMAIILFTNPSGWGMTDTEAAIVGVILLIFAVLNLLWLWCIRKQIAFTAVLLKSVAAVLIRTPELLLIQLLMAGAVLGAMALWGSAYIQLLSVAEGKTADDEGWDKAGGFGIWIGGQIWAFVSLFWLQFTLLNIAFVTTCASVGAWYFSPDTYGKHPFCLKPPVWWGLLRAFTFSFGSIAFGSLVLAIMRTIIVVVQSLAQRAEAAGGFVARCACCCLICCLKCIEGTLNWLTEYAFVYVAIYGQNYCSSGARVFSLLGKAGAQAIIQQTLLTPLMYMSALLGLAAGCLVGWGAHEQVGSDGLSENASNLQFAVAIVSGGAVGYLVMSLGVNVPIGAGCKTLLVCFAEEPEHLKQVDPVLYAAFSGRVKVKAQATRTSGVGVGVPPPSV